MPTATGLGFASLFVGALLAFKTLPPRTAALLVFFGGWLFAPVGVFPAGSAQAEHPYWILGSALPSDMVWQKAWAVPLAVLAGAMAFDRTWLPAWRPSWFDAPVVFWCSWPLLQWLWLPDAQPAPLLSSLHLLGTWGFSWLIGRIYCSGPDGQLALARALALAGAACLPFALLEGLAGLQTYPWFFELHPFRNDGVLRRVGWRPVAFFENGNQYGLWVSLCALVAVALAWQRGRSSRNWRAVGWAAASIALAAQSTGGILLVVLGGILLAMSSRLRPRDMFVAGLSASVLLSAVYGSGLVPIARIAYDTSLGRAAVVAVKSAGGASFTWRIAQDQRALPLVAARPWGGSGQWDWWRSQPARPWGLAMLLLGQFGIVGMALAASVLLLPSARVVWRMPRGDPLAPTALPWVMAIVILLAMLDALLNSFVFFPAVCIAGALCDATRPTASAATENAR